MSARVLQRRQEVVVKGDNVNGPVHTRLENEGQHPERTCHEAKMVFVVHIPNNYVIPLLVDTPHSSS